MKLVRYGRAGAERPGLVDAAGRLRDLSRVVPDITPEALSPVGLKRLRAVKVDRLPLVKGKPRLGCPLVGIGKIVCIGLNYRAHAAETNLKLPGVPILFNKYNNALAAHNCTITLPPREVSYKFDYETELLIVIGRSARNVPEADALNYVAGYCTAHDFSARDLQLETPSVQWMIGKTLDNFGPIGPYFVSADRVGDPNSLKIETYVNGERRQSSNTSFMIFNPQKLIAYITKMWTLEPGDIIWSGTPEGVILGYPKEKQVWLKAGDEIVSTIEKLGTLKFTLA